MGTIDRLPEHLKTGRTAEAIMAPSSVLFGGVGASVAVLVGAPVVAALGIGALVYGGLVALRLPRKRKSAASTIDPMGLSETWRLSMMDALDAQRRFGRVVDTVGAGPIRDRLVEIATQVDAAVREAARVARRGDAIDEGVAALSLERVRAQLDHARANEPSSADPTHSSWEATVSALEAQHASGSRLATVAADARSKLGVLNARLDEAVARAVELSLQADDAGDLSNLGADVDGLVSEMESLRLGLEEVGRTA